MLDCSQMTYAQMADIVNAIRAEVQERNSIGVNWYLPHLAHAVCMLEEISAGEKRNFTSESGPVEP